MSTLTDLVTAASKPKLKGCGVARLLDKLNASERAELVALMADPAKTNRAFELVFNERGHEVGYQVFQRHRSGACPCPR